MTNTPPYDMSRYHYTELLGIIASDNQNPTLRVAAIAEKGRRDLHREDARDTLQRAIAQDAAKAAQDAAKATRMAAWATIAAAIAAFLSFLATAYPIIKAAWFPQTTAAQAPYSGAAPTTHQ